MFPEGFFSGVRVSRVLCLVTSKVQKILKEKNIFCHTNLSCEFSKKSRALTTPIG